MAQNRNKLELWAEEAGLILAHRTGTAMCLQHMVQDLKALPSGGGMRASIQTGCWEGRRGPPELGSREHSVHGWGRVGMGKGVPGSGAAV